MAATAVITAVAQTNYIAISITVLFTMGAGLLGKQVWHTFRAPGAVARRADEAFVRKDTCDKCSDGTAKELEHLRGFVEAVDSKTTRIETATNANGVMLAKIAGKMGL